MEQDNDLVLSKCLNKHCEGRSMHSYQIPDTGAAIINLIIYSHAFPTVTCQTIFY